TKQLMKSGMTAPTGTPARSSSSTARATTISCTCLRQSVMTASPGLVPGDRTPAPDCSPSHEGRQRHWGDGSPDALAGTTPDARREALDHDMDVPYTRAE